MEGNPVKFNIDYPEKLSRGLLILKTLFGGIYVGIPHGFCLFFYGIWAGICLFISWWAILFTGKIPQGMFNTIVSYYRWGARVGAYMNYLTDAYPPFNGKE